MCQVNQEEMKTEESEAMIRWAGLARSHVFIFDGVLLFGCAQDGSERTDMTKIDETNAVHAVMGNVWLSLAWLRSFLSLSLCKWKASLKLECEHLFLALGIEVWPNNLNTRPA